MDEILTNIVAAASPLGGVIYLLIVTALIDTGAGIWAALSSGTFNLGFVDTFVRSHVFEKWGPIVGTLIAGIAIGGTDNLVGTGLVSAGAAQIVAYEAATISSVFGNIAEGQAKTKGLPTSVEVPTT